MGISLGDWEMFSLGKVMKLVVFLCALELVILLAKGRVKNLAESFLGERVCFGVVTFITAMLIALSEYLYWTELCAGAIDGMHGRYFIYALLPLYFVLVGKTSPGEAPEKFGLGTKSVAALVNLFAGMTLLFGSL